MDMKPANAPVTDGTLLPFYFKDLPIRGRLLRLDGFEVHVPSLAGAANETCRALAEMLALASLMVHDGAKRYDVTLQIQHAHLGEDKAGLMFARCTTDGQLKAYANPTAKEGNLDKWLDGKGVFAVVLSPVEGGDAMQSIVPLISASPASCVLSYYNDAVQTPTRLVTALKDDKVAVLFMQGLPGVNTSEGDEGDDWRRLTLMIQTATPGEMVSGELSGVDLLQRLFAEDDVMVEKEEPIEFATSTPRTAMLQALASLPAAELRGLLENGPIEMQDETTGSVETFTEGDVAHLLVEGQA